MNQKERTQCNIFISHFFDKKNYSLTIPKHTVVNKEKLKEATLEGLLFANKEYKKNNNIYSIYNFKFGTSFLNDKTHESEIQKRIPKNIQETTYAKSVSGQYKIFVISQKLNEKYSVNK